MPTEYPHAPHWPRKQVQQSFVQPPLVPVPGQVPQPPIVWLPPAANDRNNLRFFGGCMMAIGLLEGFLQVSHSLDISLPPLARLGDLSLDFILPGMLMVYGIMFFIQARRWEQVNQRRQMAAAWGYAAGVPLVEPQPLPNAEALPLPFKVKLEANWFASYILFWLLGAILLLLQLNSYSQEGWSLQQSLGHLLYNWPFLLLFPLSTLAFCIIWVSLPQSIEVTAQGLIIRHPLHDWFKMASGPLWKWTIAWNEIRLFAIREGKPGASKVRYELASPFKVVTFARVVRPRWWSLCRPAQPFDDYNAQMDALLAEISARTGLLLYDVR